MKITGKQDQVNVTIAEMSSDGSDSADLGFDIPFDTQKRDELIDGDKHPMFVTLDVLSEGVSRNNRDWTDKDLARVADMINRKHPDGYSGHLTEEERKTKYPDPQTIWLGAVVKEVKGKLRLFAKGYVLPEAKARRSYLKKAKVLGKNVAVSVYGTVSKAAKTARGALDMSTFNLESIDWARPGSEGVPNSGVMQISAEMFEEKEPKEGQVDKIEAIKGATKAELQEHSAVVGEMITEAVTEQTKESQAVVSEMTEVRESLGLKETDSVKDTVAEMQQELRESKIDSAMRAKIDSPSARKMLRSSVVKEMHGNAELTADAAVDAVLKSSKGAAVMKNVTARKAAPAISPLHDKPKGTADRHFSKRVG